MGLKERQQQQQQQHAMLIRSAGSRSRSTWRGVNMVESNYILPKYLRKSVWDLNL